MYHKEDRMTRCRNRIIATVSIKIIITPIKTDHILAVDGVKTCDGLVAARTLCHVIPRLQIINISDYLDRGTLRSLVVPGDFIFVQGAQFFSSTTEQAGGPEQLCTGTRLANHVKVGYVFDRWEATSISARPGFPC